MESGVLIVLAIVVALVAIDALGRLDERKRGRTSAPDEAAIATQKIIVDLTKRQ